ncbi:hypothetical protein HN51_044870, partial [Arachis hypogaea]
MFNRFPGTSYECFNKPTFEPVSEPRGAEQRSSASGPGSSFLGERGDTIADVGQNPG